MIGRMEPATSSVTFRNDPSAPPPAYSSESYPSNSKFHVQEAVTGRPKSALSDQVLPPIHQHPQYGQLMNDLRAHQLAQISQPRSESEVTQSAGHIPQIHVTAPNDPIANNARKNDNNNNNNNNIIVLPPPPVQPAVMAAPVAQAPQVTAININGGGGPRRYKRKANHLVHFLLSVVFWPWLFVWCGVCCRYGCPNFCCCCCCDDGDTYENCCPKIYEDSQGGTTWI